MSPLHGFDINKVVIRIGYDYPSSNQHSIPNRDVRGDADSSAGDSGVVSNAQSRIPAEQLHRAFSTSNQRVATGNGIEDDAVAY
ncbi:hypothetical protein [Nocardioides sp.]|uniref:hypothetical protein n=1 Tax=Nocardioides sp. TaxID=35761 RepID=UPI003219AAD3